MHAQEETSKVHYYRCMLKNVKTSDHLLKTSPIQTLEEDRIDDGQDIIEAPIIAKRAKCQDTRKVHYNNTMIQRAEKWTNRHTECSTFQLSSTEANPSEASYCCCFRGKSAGTDSLHEARTFQRNCCMWESAVLVEDTLSLDKLSMSNMVALESRQIKMI